jgi:GTP cyclohydrolase I
MEKAVYELLIGLGQEDKAEVMENTPRRVADLYIETINPGWVDVDEVFKAFENPGITGHDMIIVNDVHYVSMCEHHLAPAFGVAHFAYVPNEKIVGYSKVKKGLNYVARGPQLNERILADTLDIVEAQIEPLGCALILQSVHCCIALRSNGPAQEIVQVMGFRGCLRDDPWRREFFAASMARKPMFLGQ